MSFGAQWFFGILDQTIFMHVRISKTVLVAALALFFSLVVFNNVFDYDSNYQFVKHVLSMDTTFEGNKGMWRAITSPTLHHVFYVGIILAEALAAVLCWSGAWGLYKSRQAPAVFKKKKTPAIYGLTLAILIWFVGFIAVGGEWFLMWQSEVRNGLDAAFRISAISGIALIYLILPDGE